jgi:lipopolysaccharide biosynthesis protein/CDP-glycerol glycerophosphotransferase (TagB/SpsB family)
MEKMKDEVELLNASAFLDDTWYRAQYPDVDMLQMRPAEHYLRIGAQLRRNPSELFDTAYYVETYPDVLEAAINPLVHYLRFGSTEGRSPRRQPKNNPRKENQSGQKALVAAPGGSSNEAAVAQLSEGLFFSENYSQYESSLKIAVHLHVFYDDMWPEFYELLKNIPQPCSLFVTCPNDRLDRVKETILRDRPDAELIGVENFGYDVLPFLRLTKRLNAENYDLVCKLHTKKGNAGLERKFSEVEGVWSRLCVRTLLERPEFVNAVIAAFEQDTKLGMVGPARLYKSARTLMYGNESDVGSLLAQLGRDLPGEADWGFFAGTMFWARVPLFAQLADVIESVLPKTDESRNAKTAELASLFHATERVLGILPIIDGKNVGLVYERSLAASTTVVDTNVPPGSCASATQVSTTLLQEMWIERDYAKIKEARSFDTPFYYKQNPSIRRLGIDPIYHYLSCGWEGKADPAPWFSSEMYLRIHRDVRREHINPFSHYLTHGKKDGRTVFPSLNNFGAAASIIGKAGVFSSEYYLANNDDLRAAGMDPIKHYCQFGWKELRKPNAWFDGWWYGVNYLSDFPANLNPLLHYALVGKEAGFLPAPIKNEQNRIGTGLSYEKEQGAVTRICLFAGYDVDGIVDDYVIVFLKELSKFSDIYYLADSDMPQAELDKLSPYVKGAWAQRHQMYDFGSYSLLAKKFVGWDKIDEYDELLLVNDSSYLVGDLSVTFAKMHDRQCDWWGLQATKGISATREKECNKFPERITIETVKNSLLSTFEDDYTYDFLVGSYFLCYRRRVVSDKGFRKLLDNVKKEANKKLVIQKYEIGFTKYLINSGFEFDTFIDWLYPFHPIFTENHFELMRLGFPLFKRFFLTENHYRVPELHRWKNLLLDVYPETDLALIEKNLHRVANNEKLYANLHVAADGTIEYQRLLSDTELEDVDAHVEKNDNWWVFPVCGYNHTLGGNERAIFEHVKNDGSIKKIILTRSRHVALDGENVVIVPLRSVRGQQYLLQSKFVFIKHAPKVNVPYPLRSDLRHFVNLWHGIPLKRIGTASIDQQLNLNSIHAEHAKCKAVIASSKIDRMAMAAAFYPLTFNDVWTTGLPRNDFVVRDENALPEDMKEDMRRVREMTGGKKLVLYAPTFRNDKENGYYSFSKEEKQRLQALLEKHGCVLGIREHLADKTRNYSSELASIGVLNLGDKSFSNIEILYRCADVLITDYSSCFIDFMLTSKPMLSFAYDYDRYISEERGLFYDMEMVFPGPICKTFDVLHDGLERALENQMDQISERYIFARSIFFDYLDDKNSERVVAQVNSI